MRRREQAREYNRESYRERYRNDPAFRERERGRKREQARERYWSDPEFRERTLASVRERQVWFRAGGVRWSAYVDNKEEVLAARAAFRAEQKREYKEAADGGFHQTVA